MNPQEEAFLCAIAESADPDADSLVYSDWLADQGDERRAAFTRDVVRFARGEIPQDDYDEFTRHLDDRRRELDQDWVGRCFASHVRALRFRVRLLLRLQSDSALVGVLESGTVSVGQWVLLPVAAGKPIRARVANIDCLGVSRMGVSAGEAAAFAFALVFSGDSASRGIAHFGVVTAVG